MVKNGAEAPFHSSSISSFSSISHGTRLDSTLKRFNCWQWGNPLDLIANANKMSTNELKDGKKVYFSWKKCLDFRWSIPEYFTAFMFNYCKNGDKQFGP